MSSQKKLTSYEIQSLFQARLCFGNEAVDEDEDYGNHLFHWLKKNGATYGVTDVDYELHDSANKGDVKMKSEVRLIYKSRSKFDDMVDDFVMNEVQGPLTFGTSFSSYVRHYYSEKEEKQGQGHGHRKYNVLVVLFAPPCDDAFITTKVIKGEGEDKFLCCHVASIPNALLHYSSLASKKGSLGGSHEDKFTTPPSKVAQGGSGFPPCIKKMYKARSDPVASNFSPSESSSDYCSIDSLCTEALMKEIAFSPKKKQKKL